MVHLPVMAREVVDMLRPRDGGIYVDATVGPGGHAEQLAGHVGSGRLICLDRDPEALEGARERLGAGTAVFRKARFSEMRTVLTQLGIERVDGVLMDLGISMLQMKGPARGMSFLADEPLDMRMDPEAPLTAHEIVNAWPEAELALVIREYGEERRARRIARAIVTRRRREPIGTCSDLAGVIARAVPGRSRTHPATRTFQALRIAVNDELGELERALPEALATLRPGGRLAVISYHSLEDRIVKHFLRDRAREGTLRLLTKKPLVPGREEVTRNPSARSAKLRAAEAC